MGRRDEPSDDDREKPLDYAGPQRQLRIEPETKADLITAAVGLTWIVLAAMILAGGMCGMFTIRAP
jgi:hypothetical protein